MSLAILPVYADFSPLFLKYRSTIAVVGSNQSQAYEEGRSTNDPSEGWYNGELWFFDNYVVSYNLAPPVLQHQL
jgi:hypothetical protein